MKNIGDVKVKDLKVGDKTDHGLVVCVRPDTLNPGNVVVGTERDGKVEYGGVLTAHQAEDDRAIVG